MKRISILAIVATLLLPAGITALAGYAIDQEKAQRHRTSIA